MWLAALVVSAGAAAAPGGAGRALVVHSQPHFALAYAELVAALGERFAAVDVVAAKGAGGVAVKRDKQFVYELVVFAASRAPNCLQLADQLGLLEFFDQGGRVLLLGGDSVTQGWRLLLGLLGFDVLAPGAPLPVAHLQNDPHERVLSVDRAEVPFPELARGLRAELLFDGRALRLTPRETQQVGVFVPVPPGAVLVEPNGALHQVLDPTAALIAYSQGRLTPARVVASGSTRLFSNALMRLSDGDNRRLLENLLDWLAFRSMSVRVQRFAFCATLAADCAPARTFLYRQPVYARFQAVDAAGQLLTDPTGFSLELSKMHPQMRRGVRLEMLGGEPFFVLDFVVFDRLGVYRSKLEYSLPGVYLDAAEAAQELVFREESGPGSRIFGPDHLPFLLICALVLLSAASVFWLAAARSAHKWSSAT